ncbi:hypothetical protein BC826DRAFT_1034056, partial [Russula brevipes]
MRLPLRRTHRFISLYSKPELSKLQIFVWILKFQSQTLVRRTGETDFRFSISVNSGIHHDNSEAGLEKMGHHPLVTCHRVSAILKRLFRGIAYVWWTNYYLPSFWRHWRHRSVGSQRCNMCRFIQGGQPDALHELLWGLTFFLSSWWKTTRWRQYLL